MDCCLHGLSVLAIFEFAFYCVNFLCLFPRECELNILKEDVENGFFI